MPSAIKPKLLMVTHRVPHPPNRGDRIRTWHLLRELSAQFDIHLACIADEPVSFDSWREMKKHAVELAIEPGSRLSRYTRGFASLASGRSFTEGAFFSPALKATIDRWAADHAFDAALGVCSSTARYIQHLPIARKVLDLVDTDSRKWADYADASRGPARSLYQLEAERVAQCEREIGRNFDAVTVVTQREAQSFSDIAPLANVVVAANGVDRSFFSPRFHQPEPVAVFTGVLNYRPNVEGITWLARHIWPHITQNIAGARLRIVGRDPSRAVQRLAEINGVEVIGSVPDVRPYLHEAAVAVAPMRIARGVQNKVLEAMSMALPVVTTPQAAAGVHARDGEEFLVADSSNQWIEGLTNILTNTHFARTLGQAARQFVDSTHRWDQCLRPLCELLHGEPAVAAPSLREAA